MNAYTSVADDYYINVNLNTEMTLPQGRETVLGFFERVQKQYPSMRNFYTRENGDFVLEEDKDNPHQRWISLEPRRICSGVIDPAEVDVGLRAACSRVATRPVHAVRQSRSSARPSIT